jgi:hypothetical protein
MTSSAMSPQSAVVGLGVVAPRCSAPRNDFERSQCAAIERQILDATVFLRFTLHCGRNGDRSQVALVPSHATAMDGQTLLTHDHYLPLSDPSCDASSLEVSTARGALIAEITDATVLAELARQLRPGPAGSSCQTRVVRFPDPLFAGVLPLSFEQIHVAISSSEPEQWGELAEIDWVPFPNTTKVHWVRSLRIERRGAALGLVVDRAVEVGASGGGVFRVTPGGLVHVGNIWGTWQDDDTSIVALNQAAALAR